MVRSLKLELELPKSMYLDESADLVRVYRYPRGSVDEELAKGMHVHTDSSLLSILNEDQVGGLQFLKDDQWLDVKPIPSTLIVNLGDMMQVIINALIVTYNNPYHWFHCKMINISLQDTS